MAREVGNEIFEEQQVTYLVEHEGTIVVIAHVPARVNTETGERFSAPETVEKIHAILHARSSPTTTIHASVFEFAA